MREVITKLHECMHRISIKTNTAFFRPILSFGGGERGRGIQQRNAANIGDNVVRENVTRAIDILVAINISCRARVFAQTCLFITNLW